MMYIHALRRLRALAIAVPLAGVATAADAGMVISSTPTKNVVCSEGVCAPTGNNAVLNASDLQNMLAAGNVKVTTTGSNHQVNYIRIAAALTWVSANTLTLDAYQSIIVGKPVTVAGSGGLTILTNDGGTGGTFSFGTKANIAFWNLSSSLTINGAAYTLVNNVSTLASDVTVNPNGYYALAGNYDASADGVYAQSPIQNAFTGRFEGLGNSISNLAIAASLRGRYVGLFAEIDSPGVVENLGLANTQVSAGRNADVGALVGHNSGLLWADSVSGSVVSGNNSNLGGLVGNNFGGTITNSHSTATVHGCCCPGGLAGVNGGGEIDDSYATGAVVGNGGGLVCENGGTIDSSYATGSVRGREVGGLASVNNGTIKNSYATGRVSGGVNAVLGGLIGLNESSSGIVIDSYSTGIVAGGSGSTVGGLVGTDNSTGNITTSYWDTTTSGIANSSQGAGNIANDPGITGLTTIQLQAGLPTGFSSTVWTETATINGGWPYLLDIPQP